MEESEPLRFEQLPEGLQQIALRSLREADLRDPTMARYICVWDHRDRSVEIRVQFIVQ